MSALSVVMPIGPNCKPAFVADTLDSIRSFSPAATRVILVDDSRRQTGAAVADRFSEVLVAEAHGSFGALYLNLADGFRRALDQSFDVLLRIDTDALVAAPFVEVAQEFFNMNPQVGSVGSYRVSYEGLPRSFAWAKRRLIRSMTIAAPLHPRTAWTTLQLTRRARRHGYVMGESVLGGVCLYSRRAVEDLASGQLLPDPALAATGVHEDQIFGLSLKALGYDLAGFGTVSDDLPFGVRHVGLPAHPSELLAKGKALIHSTKSFGELSEVDIRALFAASRH